MKRTNLAVSLTLALGVASGGLASHAAAQGVCAGFGNTTFASAHPIVTDLIGLQVHSWLNPQVATPPATTTLSRVVVNPDYSVAADVVVTPHPEKYADYQVVVAPYDDFYGLMGPFPLGDHLVRTSVTYEDEQGNITAPCGGPFLFRLTIGTEKVDTVRAPVIEYYNASYDHYFMTQDAGEIAALDGGAFAGWARTGETFLAFVTGKSENLARPVCRYYGIPVPGQSTHFYSNTTTECLALEGPPASSVWTLESSDVFEAGIPDRTSGVCALGEAPLYRLWNGRTDTNHRFTTSASTREQMVAKGWISEGYGPDGVAMCIPVR